MELDNLLNTFVLEEIPTGCFASQLAKGHHHIAPCSLSASQAGRGWHTLQTLIKVCALQNDLQWVTKPNHEPDGKQHTQEKANIKQAAL